MLALVYQHRQRLHRLCYVLMLGVGPTIGKFNRIKVETGSTSMFRTNLAPPVCSSNFKDYIIIYYTALIIYNILR